MAMNMRMPFVHNLPCCRRCGDYTVAKQWKTVVKGMELGDEMSNQPMMAMVRNILVIECVACGWSFDAPHGDYVVEL